MWLLNINLISTCMAARGSWAQHYRSGLKQYSVVECKISSKPRPRTKPCIHFDFGDVWNRKGGRQRRKFDARAKMWIDTLLLKRHIFGECIPHWMERMSKWITLSAFDMIGNLFLSFEFSICYDTHFQSIFASAHIHQVPESRTHQHAEGDYEPFI